MNNRTIINNVEKVGLTKLGTNLEVPRLGSISINTNACGILGSGFTLSKLYQESDVLVEETVKKHTR